MSEIMNVDLSNQNIKNIMMNKDITDSDKEIFQDVLESVNVEDISMDMFSKLPSSILNLLFSDSTYNGVLIRTEDKIRLLNMEQDVRRLPESVLKALLIEIEIDHVKISVDDQIVFLNKMGTLKKDAEVEEVYAIIDDLPKSIKKVVEPFMNLDKIKDIALFLVLLYVLSALFTYIESISMTTVSNHFAKILRRRISRKINKLPLKYFDKNSTGDILSRVTNDVDTLAQTMNQSLATLVSAITLFLGTIIMMFLTNYLMAITAILSSLFGFVFMFIVLGKSQKYFTAKQEELGHLNGHIEEVYSGLNVVKAYNGKEISSLKFQELNKKMYEANRKSQFLSSLMMPMMNFIGNFGYVAVCIVGALLTMDNKISFGVIVAFISYVRLFTSPLAQIAQAFTNLQSAAAASERIFEFIDEEEMIKEENKKYLEKEKVKGDIEFKNVVFQYDGTDHPTIKNFTASAKSGEKIAIVGPTGAGKTTMVNLLMKFYELTGGDIKIDGVSTKELTRENIHSLFTMVLQDTWLFDGTIKENIAYNRDHVTEEHIKEVCKTVGLDHFIRTLPNGYDSYVSDNDSVSAGQRQLLTIARGMIEDAPFLILDEATSNVDTRTEELVQKAMDKLMEGRTSFIIAHRLSTIKNADLILVMKDGNIIEQGSHDELIEKKGFYADLYNSQFQS
ncbi:MAG: ABC transporter ATP-binding protein [Bacilli bacterium]|nr:ABC transporter ATP-binding protein [Bacilli bacterium]